MTTRTDERSLQVLLAATLGNDQTSWSTWIAVLRAALGLPLSTPQRRAFRTVAGDRHPPGKRIRELWAIAGRRSGKSRMAALVAIFFALFNQYKLSRGERGTVLVIAETQETARIVFDYAVGMLESSPTLAREIEAVVGSEIRLKSGIRIAVHSNSYRSVRGRTLLACVFDEAAFWRSEESASPDVEVYRAVLPSLATTGGMLVGISTPYRKVGLLHKKWRDYYGQDSDDTLVVQGASPTFNPTIDKRIIKAAIADDPEGAIAEWEATFRTDISAFLDDNLIERAVDHGRPLELTPQPGVRYVAFVDACGGGHDHYTMAIAHAEGERIIIDAVRGVAPSRSFDPDVVTKNHATLAKEYRVSEVVGDNYAKDWVQKAWAATGLRYKRSEDPRSDLYLNALPAFTRGIVSLPDHTRLLRELLLLERHTSRSGKDNVDHGRNGSDDYANVVAGAINLLTLRKAPMQISDEMLARAKQPSYRPATIDYFSQTEEQRIARAKSDAWWAAQRAGPQPAEPIRAGCAHSAEVAWGPDGARSARFSDLHDLHLKGKPR